MPKPVDLPLKCVHCQRPIWVCYQPDQDSSEVRRYAITCPYAECQKTDAIPLYGSIPSVTARTRTASGD